MTTTEKHMNDYATMSEQQQHRIYIDTVVKYANALRRQQDASKKDLVCKEDSGFAVEEEILRDIQEAEKQKQICLRRLALMYLTIIAKESETTPSICERFDSDLSAIKKAQEGIEALRA